VAGEGNTQHNGLAIHDNFSFSTAAPTAGSLPLFGQMPSGMAGLQLEGVGVTTEAIVGQEVRQFAVYIAMCALHGMCMQRQEQQDFNLVGTLAATHQCTVIVEACLKQQLLACRRAPATALGFPSPPLLAVVQSPVCHTLLSILCSCWCLAALYAQVARNRSPEAYAVNGEAVAAAAAATVTAVAAAAAGSSGLAMDNGALQLGGQRAAGAAAAAAGQQVGFTGEGQICMCYSIGGSIRSI
jgi:hypothetical protein